MLTHAIKGDSKGWKGGQTPPLSDALWKEERKRGKEGSKSQYVVLDLETIFIKAISIIWLSVQNREGYNGGVKPLCVQQEDKCLFGEPRAAQVKESALEATPESCYIS